MASCRRATAALALASIVVACAPDASDGGRGLVRAPLRIPGGGLAGLEMGRPPVDVAAAGAPPVADPAPAAPAVVLAPPPAAPPPMPGPVVRQPPPRPERVAAGPAAAPPPTSAAVHPADFPDPFVFRSGAFWYAVSTQRGATHVPVMRSLDLRTWEPRGDALARLPSWSEFGHVWAPAVLPVQGAFVLYYATRHSGTGLQCISTALAVLPEGPYVDASSEPLICQLDQGGSIDPSPFLTSDGHPWLVWKSEGTLDGEPTRLWSQPLDDRGQQLLDRPHELLATALPWERPIIEGPTMAYDGGRYHLLYSANRWETPSYAMGHATCAGPAGPCTRSRATPVLASGPREAGPGGGELFRGPDGGLRLAYHAWDPARVGYPAGARRLHLAIANVAGATLTIARG